MLFSKLFVISSRFSLVSRVDKSVEVNSPWGGAKCCFVTWCNFGSIWRKRFRIEHRKLSPLSNPLATYIRPFESIPNRNLLRRGWRPLKGLINSTVFTLHLSKLCVSKNEINISCGRWILLRENTTKKINIPSHPYPLHRVRETRATDLIMRSCAGSRQCTLPTNMRTINICLPND